jgi:hypothetical protein
MDGIASSSDNLNAGRSRSYSSEWGRLFLDLKTAKPFFLHIAGEWGDDTKQKVQRVRIMEKGSIIRSIHGGVLFMLVLQGCMATSSSLPANKAFALSASTLSGMESYAFDGVVSVVDPGGWVSDKANYQGQVASHGNLKIQWNGDKLQPASVKSSGITAFQPLQLLKAITGKTAVISYAETPKPQSPVRFKIKLDDNAAKARVVESLKKDMSIVGAEGSLVKGDQARAKTILAEANKKLDAAIATLRVTTECEWVADSKTWYPSRMTENTVLTYKWDKVTKQEKRVSETNFLIPSSNGTMKKLQR